jgi:hypothetical protein
MRSGYEHTSSIDNGVYFRTDARASSQLVGAVEVEVGGAECECSLGVPEAARIDDACPPVVGAYGIRSDEALEGGDGDLDKVDTEQTQQTAASPLPGHSKLTPLKEKGKAGLLSRSTSMTRGSA